MLTTKNHDILFDDVATIALMQNTGHSAIKYNDCTNNIYTPQIADYSGTDRNYSGDSEAEDDLLFNDVDMIEARLGRGYFQMTTANANCDCGR